MAKATSGFTTVKVNGVKYAVPSGIADAEHFAVAVPTGREPYGPVIQWRLHNPSDGTYLAALLPQGFIGRCVTVNTPGGTATSGINVAVRKVLTDFTSSGDAEGEVASGYVIGTSGVDAAVPATGNYIVGSLEDSGVPDLTANVGEDTFLQIQISGAATALSGKDGDIDVCVFGDVPHPLLSDFLG